MKDHSIISNKILQAPVGIAIFAMLGPAFIWCAEYIGSGEVILATRTGAILGPSILWAVVLGIFLKYWIGLCGARYTVCTGEGMVDMFARIPGPRNWVVWLVLCAQFASATLAIGSIASAAGVFLHSLLPISSFVGGWLVTISCLAIAWLNLFDLLKMTMSFFVVIIIIGVLYVAVSVIPTLFHSYHGPVINIPQVPDWAKSLDGMSGNAWREILPLIGWGAGGFASQVWYTYWVLGAGYGAAKGRPFGKPADTAFLKGMDSETARKIYGWCRVVYVDATVAMVIGVVVTSSFLLAGAGVLGPLKMAPQGEDVALTLSTIFSSKWGALGGLLFMLAGIAALVSTQLGQLAGWPRLLADAFRLCVPRFHRLSWNTQYRIFLIFFFCTNMIIIYTLGFKPIVLVKVAAVLDGLLLTPLQAIWVAIGLYVVMPKLLSKDASVILKAHGILLAGLIIAFAVFGYFCLFQLPFLF
jgi:Mn2+/Fe2+ NRAMP family transporter